MAQLHVTAVAPYRPAITFFFSEVLVAASVTTSDGDGVTNLEDQPDSLSDAFGVKRLVAPGTTDFGLLSVTPRATAVPGLYLLSISQATRDVADRWTEGDWPFVLTVRNGDNRGQTVFWLSFGPVLVS